MIGIVAAGQFPSIRRAEKHYGITLQQRRNMLSKNFMDGDVSSRKVGLKFINNDSFAFDITRVSATLMHGHGG